MRRGWRYPRTRFSSCCGSAATTNKAEQADQQLPDQVDTERDRGILDQLGIDPQDLLGNLGGLGDKLGL
jgi:hypothetical protein